MDFKNITVKSYNLTSNQIVTQVKTVANKTLAYFFSSYDSTICKLDIINNVIYVHKNWNYSTTTTKWFNKFLSIVLEEEIKFTGQTEIKTKNNIFTVIMLDK